MMTFLSLSLSSVFSFSLALLFIVAALRFADTVGLVAMVGEHRQHEKPTPVIGGLAMFCAVFIILAILPLTLTREIVSSELDLMLIYHYLAGATLLVIVGVLDDRFHLPFLLRFIAQIAAVLIMIKQGNTLESLGQLFSNDTVLLGNYAIPMTVFASVGVINALNMSDGLDGLASGFCVLAFIVLLLFPFTVSYLVIIYVWLGALTAFLLFNLRIKRPARAFMGDAGSTLLGYTLAWLFIYGSQQEIETVANPRYFPPIFAVWVLALPLFETVSLMILRAIEGNSPFHADRGHLHHHLLSKFKSVNLTLMILLLWFSLYAGLGYALNKQGVVVYNQTVLFSVLFVLHFVFQSYLRRKMKQKNSTSHIV